MKAALVGTGRIAREHLGALSRLPAVEVAAVCDLSAAAAQASAERFGIETWYTDHRALLSEVRPDVVHVTTPADTHTRIALDALEAGSHVIVEKPAARTPAELEELLDRAQSGDRMVIETYNYLFNAPIRRLSHLVSTGEAGDVVHVEVMLCLDIVGPDSPFADPNRPHPALGFAGGAISDFLPHLAALVHAFAGEHRVAHAVWARRDPASPVPWDELRALVEGERATGAVCFSSHVRPEAFTVDLLATRMRMRAGLFEPRLVIERVHALPKPLNPVVNGLVEAGEAARGAVGGLARKLGGGPGAYEGLWALVERTYAAVANGSAPPVSPDQMRAVHRLAADIAATAPPR
jgi:predicted dehydrogenase